MSTVLCFAARYLLLFFSLSLVFGFHSNKTFPRVRFTSGCALITSPESTTYAIAIARYIYLEFSSKMRRLSFRVTRLSLFEPIKTLSQGTPTHADRNHSRRALEGKRPHTGAGCSNRPNACCARVNDGTSSSIVVYKGVKFVVFCLVRRAVG